MEKHAKNDVRPPSWQRNKWVATAGVVALVLICRAALLPRWTSLNRFCAAGPTAVHGLVSTTTGHVEVNASSPYGEFPVPNDPFRFLPCTFRTVPPDLNDTGHEQTWAKLFDPNPEHWSWGRPAANTSNVVGGGGGGDKYEGRGVYLCGYLDVALDYTNSSSDKRIARLAVTKYQASGLALNSTAGRAGAGAGAGKKSERTIVIEPGGPGGSGTSYAWRAAETVTQRFSDGKFDVLGWDPRGVNISLPAVACFPYDVDRDRWALFSGQYREVSPSPRAQLEIADAMNDAIFRACWEKYGDLGRFMGTAFVARDMEEIRKALGEDELTGYLVSYGTGIGQTYASMFPDSVGRMILDGTEYVRDHRLLGGFGFTALDNVTNAWHDGFLGECIHAGPKYCTLAQPLNNGTQTVALDDLGDRMGKLMEDLIERPVAGYSETSGPTLITYTAMVSAIYGALYNARSWPGLARMLCELEAGNTTLAATFLENWYYDPTQPCPAIVPKPSTEELTSLVVCADSYDAPQPAEGLDWWLSLWANMTEQSWIAGNSRFYSVFPCRQFIKYWPHPAEVYRGDLDHTLKHPVLLIAETYDPATPLRNGRRLAQEMGKNARLIVHHGYGHSSRDTSNCTDSIAKAFILNGTVPESAETDCYADEKPYLYGHKNETSPAGIKLVGQLHEHPEDPVKEWREHLKELAAMNPRLLPGH
ncbi:hypothetical protein QBC46DRAFT_261965 [Diplogelasinospora grovesii]|uniref:Hydrolase n=1 Tax=Diplogelasinospora grovesii TaxID=303347 RepID=A0AAN6N6H5_9PEZI|nr:hypothetical protein QBC46DRAFT_261965 [Diplogelasinospora grovesii]